MLCAQVEDVAVEQNSKYDSLMRAQVEYVAIEAKS